MTIVDAPWMAGEGRQPVIENGAHDANAMTRPAVVAIDQPGANLSRLAEALRGDGYDMLVVASTVEALALVASRTVRCIVLPMGDAVSALRKTPAAAQVSLFVTLPASEAVLVGLALEAGADDCAPVSGDFGELTARLRALLRRTQAEGGRRMALAEAAARADRELGSLSYAISHDLRAPLRAIDGFGRILLEECAGTLEARHANYLQRMVAAAGELGGLIDHLLQLSRVARAELRKECVDLTDLARRIAADLQTASPRRVDVVVDDGLTVHADRTLIRLALEHLIGNSWKFTAPSPAARIECRAARDAGDTAILVRDNGVGFDPARAGKLFQPFQRLHGREFDGAGMGLAIVHRIISRHGGRVWADGRPGHGASFSFTLPPADAGETS